MIYIIRIVKKNIYKIKKIKTVHSLHIFLIVFANKNREIGWTNSTSPP